MIQSMTGYGGSQHAEDGVSYALEVRSVNNRYFKANIKLPESLQYFEAEVDKLLRQALQRGSITYVLRMRNSSASAAYEINQEALSCYLEQLDGMTLPGGITGSVDIATLLAMPGICQAPERDEAEREKAWTILEQLTREAVDRLVAMRRTEGRALKEDLFSHAEGIRKLALEIAERAPSVVEEYQQKLRDRVAHLVSEAKLEIDRESLVREVAVYADRSDISEEIARLSSHLDQFTELCERPERVGRKLDFLTQEMLREANTIGSKSNDAAIARNVVEIKGGIDRLKEQVQNVE